MAQKKAHEVEAWLRRPDATPVVLLYGPDHGLVAERAKSYAGQTGLKLDDPFTVVRLDAEEADESGKLIDEARTVSMFAERRLIWLRGVGAQKRLAVDLESLVKEPPEATTVLIEAGDLKKGGGIRGICESGKSAIALPCYADGARELDALIDRVFGEAGLSIALAARTFLKERLGGDRLASRAEIEKIALYCRGKSTVELSDITDLSGDVAELSVDDAVDAALTGAREEFDRQYRRFCAAGGQPFLVANAAIRRMQTLRILHADMRAARKTSSAAIEAHRPPIHFSRRKSMETALSIWSVDRVDALLPRLGAAVLETRRRADLAEAIVSRTLIGLATEASRTRD